MNAQDKKKVVWVTSEKEKLSLKTFELLAQDPKLTPLRALNKAVPLVLESSRQRHVQATTTVPWLLVALAKFADDEKKQAAQRIAEETAQREEAQRTVDLSQIPATELATEVFRRLTMHFTPLIEVMLKEVLNSSSEAITEVVRESVAEAFSNLKFYPSESRPAVEKPRMKSIVIVGLLPAQAHKIRSEGFDELFNLHFWKENSPKILRQLSASCDYVVGVTKFISHAHEEIIKNNCKTGKYIRVSGGLESVETALTDILNAESAP